MNTPTKAIDLTFTIKVVNGGERIIPESLEAAQFFDKHTKLYANRLVKKRLSKLIKHSNLALIERLLEQKESIIEVGGWGRTVVPVEALLKEKENL